MQLNDNSLSFHILLSLVRFPSLTSAFFLLMLTHANTRLHRTTTTDSMMETRPKLVLLAWWRNWLKWIQLSKTYLDCGHVYIKQNNNTYMRMQGKHTCSALVCVCILVCRVCVCECVYETRASRRSRDAWNSLVWHCSRFRKDSTVTHNHRSSTQHTHTHTLHLCPLSQSAQRQHLPVWPWPCCRSSNDPQPAAVNDQLIKPSFTSVSFSDDLLHTAVRKQNKKSLHVWNA